ncbi:hypothetical protein [Streptomyces sclerotialus]|uniref:hypothetical protein n=1 Tax=Streptomyces sclerotialus TaxID=1957 RepID=UPI0004C63ED0
MRMRKPTTAAVVAAAGVLVLASCGISGDELFSNLNGTRASHARDTDTSGTQPPPADAPPNYADNSRVRQPGEMSAQDEKRARQKATEVKSALEDLRRRGEIDPSEVRPVIARLAGSASHSVTGISSLRAEKVDGSSYGIWIGDTACVTGAVNKDRVWADANGFYPESRCLPPAPTH